MKERTLQAVTDDALMAEVRRRGLVGRPAVLKPCRWCRRECGARELREHEPACEKKPAQQADLACREAS